MARSVSHESSWNTSSANATQSRVGIQPVLKTNIPEKADEENNGSSSSMAQRASRDPWLPDLEQKKYYSDEFIKLSQNPCGWIAGDRAREFFFKSKLPTVELSHIWELADIDRDGRLTMPEFAIAFHLTSLRRHGYQLPSKLPDALFDDVSGMLSDLYMSAVEIESGQDTVSQLADNKTDENWETFSEKSFSTVSSANTLPNFAVNVKDGDHLHAPVPLRMTPNSMAARTKATTLPMGRSQETMFLLNTESDILNTKEITLPSSTPSKNNTAGSIQAKREMYLRYQKRRKNHRSSDAQSTTTSASSESDSDVEFQPPSSSASCSSSRKILRNSSSEDEQSNYETTNSTQENFADFKNFDRLLKSTESLKVTSDPSEPKVEHRSDSNRKSKSLPRESSLSPGISAESATTPVPAPLRDSSPPIKPHHSESKETADPDKSRELEEIRSMVNSLKERNARLERLNQALSVELKDLIAERTSIESRLEIDQKTDKDEKTYK
ncbi:unnamed protein product [Oikopleura dioica]|uniref:EF-hand domain-containing protein n=1 Tax=Oikopleura dioica TaxID=34765 RepID=E4XNC6_OIKDI|nr:unnamed protein product [Oikopleura dioica]